MKAITWSKDSHGLFDYESKHLTKKTHKTDQPALIERESNEVKLSAYDPSDPMSTPAVDFFQRAKLLTIVNMNNTFYLESAAGNPRW